MSNHFKTALVTFGLAASAMFSSCIDKRQPLGPDMTPQDGVMMTDTLTSDAIKQHKLESDYIETIHDIEENKITNDRLDGYDANKTPNASSASQPKPQVPTR